MQLHAHQVAVITGAGSGIGAALALACGARNMRVVVADIDITAAQQTVSQLEAIGAEAIAAKVDVSQAESIAALADLCWGHYGACHLLCNNAGVSINKPLASCSASDWHWIMSVNTLGVAYSIEAFVPRMLKQPDASHIVNTASMAGIVPLVNFGSYVASKYAVVGLSEVLHEELAGSQVDVSIVCPGIVETRIYDSERNRPETPGKGPASPLSRLEEQSMQTDFNASFSRVMKPNDVACLILQAIGNKQLYVPTHPEWGCLFSQRAETIKQAFNAAQSSSNLTP